MPRRTIDLAAHINESVERGHPADFPVTLKRLYHFNGNGGGVNYVPNRVAVVRQDTGDVLSVVSDRYRLVPHQALLSVVNQATATLDVGPVPRGIYVDRGGARMRALYKFPALTQPVSAGDEICPCIQITNTYDATSRISVHIGAFRFVCTNLAVGGGGVFAGGFMAVHAGEIPIDQIADQLGSFLGSFDRIMNTYRAWTEMRWDQERLGEIIGALPRRPQQEISSGIMTSKVESVFSAYNIATNYATHRMRSARSAFDLLEQLNRGFQRQFPPGGDGTSTTPGTSVPGGFPRIYSDVLFKDFLPCIQLL